MAIILMILSFIWWWPLGLVVLGFLIARRRRWHAYSGDAHMMDWNCASPRFERRIARAQERVQRAVSRAERYYGGGWFGPSTSGNAAFDDYRAETLRRLEEEQHEFKDFLGRLRMAKDRAEFDQFMTERRQRPVEPNEPPASGQG